MASKSDIANIAIGAHSGDWVEDIDASTGRTPEAILARWNTTLETALSAHPWKFAKKSWPDQAALDGAQNPDPDMEFAYTQPGDCVRVFFVSPEATFDEWSGGIVTCDQGPTLTLIGTQRGVDIGRFSAMFCEYLGLLLAYNICTPINASEAVRARCMKDAATALDLAKTDNGRVGKVRNPVPDTFLSARIGGWRF